MHRSTVFLLFLLLILSLCLFFQISDTVCTAVCDIFATDTKGHVCLEVRSD